MVLTIDYACRSGRAVPRGLSAGVIRTVAAQVRQQIPREPSDLGLTLAALLQVSREVSVNGRRLSVSWDTAGALRDEMGRQVLGLCDTDPDEPNWAFLAVNGPMTAHRPDLALSTAAHELGHLVFDVPAALEEGVHRYRAVAACPQALDRVGRGAEGRANEFMGALLVPSVPLHTQLLAYARGEGLRLGRGPHQGRPGCPILAAGNDPEAVGGVVAALAGDFGVSERFIAVRLARYGLIQGGV